mgnify:CR=1 FL=1
MSVAISRSTSRVCSSSKRLARFARSPFRHEQILAPNHAVAVDIIADMRHVHLLDLLAVVAVGLARRNGVILRRVKKSGLVF